MALQLTAETKARFEEIVALYPEKQAALLPVLHLVQHEFGHLSVEVQALVAKELGVPHVLVHEVTTFYEMFHEHSEGQFHLEVCTNIACHLAGGDCIVDHLKAKLGVELGHQDQNGLFGLVEVECLASCGSAPMMRVGMDYYEHLTIPAVDALLGRFRELAPSLNGRAYHQAGAEPHVGPVPGFAPPAAAQNGSGSAGGSGGKRPSEAPKKGSVPPEGAKKGSVPPEGPKKDARADEQPASPGGAP